MKKALTDISKHVSGTRTFDGKQPLSSRETREQKLSDNVGVICQELNNMHKVLDALADQLDIDPKPQTLAELAGEVKAKVGEMLIMNKEIDEIAKGNGNARVKEVFEIVSKICGLMNSDEDNTVTDVKDILDTLAKCHSILGTHESEELLSKTQALRGILDAIGNTLQESDEANLHEQVAVMSKQMASSDQMLQKLRGLMSRDKDDEIVDAVSELKGACDKLVEITQADDVPYMVEKVGATWKSMDKLRHGLDLGATFQDGDVVDPVLEQVHGQQNLLDSMKKLMTAGSEKDILENLQELSEIVAKLQGMLSLDNRDEILDCVGKLHQQFRSISGIAQASEDDVVEVLTAMKGELKKLTGVMQKAERLTDTNSPEEMLAAIQQMKANESKIRDLLAGDSEESAVDQVKSLIGDAKKLQRALGCNPGDDIVAVVNGLKKQVADAEKLIQKLQAIAKCDTEPALVQKVQQLATDDGKISALLETKDGESNVDNVKANVQALRKVMTLVPDKQELNVVNRVMGLKNSLADANKVIDSLRKATQTDTNEDLMRAVKQMVLDLKKLDQLLSSETGDNLPDKAK